MNKVPVILYTSTPDEGYGYAYPSEISVEHCLRFLDSMGSDNPIHKNLAQPIQGRHDYEFAGQRYSCFWIAGAVTKESQPAYNRVVFAIMPAEQLGNGKMDVHPLWQIADDTPKEELFWQFPLPQSQTMRVAETPALEILQPQVLPRVNAENKTTAEQTRSVSTTDLPVPAEPLYAPAILAMATAKVQAAHRGIVFLCCCGIVVLFIGMYAWYGYISPTLQQVLAKCPFGKSQATFLALAKKDASISCPFGTPVYDENFNKVASVNKEDQHTLQVMLLPEYVSERHQYNQALIHYQPRKLVAVAKLLIESTEAQEIRKQWQKSAERLQAPSMQIMVRVGQIVRENFPPQVQQELFKALADTEFSEFMLRPLYHNLNQLKTDLENYEWAKLLKSRQAKEIGTAFQQRWSNLDKLECLFQIGLRCAANRWFSNEWNFIESVGEVVVPRIEQIGKQQEVQKVIRQSAYTWAAQIAENIQLTNSGSLLQGKYTKKMQEMYGAQLDILIPKLQTRGVTLGREQIVKLWQKMESDQELISLWAKTEVLIQQEIGQLLKIWVDQFFPENLSPTNHLQVLTQALMREMLYGKPEPIIVLLRNPNQPKTRTVVLDRGRF